MGNPLGMEPDPPEPSELPPHLFAEVPSFEDLGIPAGHAYPRLAYHEGTQTLIVHSAKAESQIPEQRLSIRHVNEPRYGPVMEFSSGISPSSFAIAEDGPWLLFVTLAWTERGGDWDALYRFRLDERTGEVVARRGELILPAGYQNGWMTEAMSASRDGNQLICKVGLQQSAPATVVEYWVCRFSIPEKTVTPITHLKGVFV